MNVTAKERCLGWYFYTLKVKNIYNFSVQIYKKKKKIHCQFFTTLRDSRTVLQLDKLSKVSEDFLKKFSLTLEILNFCNVLILYRFKTRIKFVFSLFSYKNEKRMCQYRIS